MKNCQKTAWLSIVTLSFGVTLLAEPVCERCEEIREYNALHHKNYDYYEDYLMTLNTTQNTTSSPETPKDHIAEVLDTRPLQDGPGRYDTPPVPMGPKRYKGVDLTPSNR